MPSDFGHRMASPGQLVMTTVLTDWKQECYSDGLGLFMFYSILNVWLVYYSLLIGFNHDRSATRPQFSTTNTGTILPPSPGRPSSIISMATSVKSF